MPNEPRVPIPTSDREVEDWRIRLAQYVGEALTQSDVLPVPGELVVTINANGTITIGISEDYIPIPAVKVLTPADSPYTILDSDEVLYCDTDTGAITALLPAGSDGRPYKIINSGQSGNDLTVTPDGTENLFGFNESFAIYDLEIIDINYESSEGWF